VCDLKRTAEIAGAGIAGLTAGLAFAQKGWRVRVHEPDSALRILGAGVYIWENGLRVLDALGVLPQVTAGIIQASRHEKRNHNGKAFASTRVGRDFRLYVPLRETLLTALHEALAATGGEVVFNSRAVAADPDGWLHFEDGTSRHADLVVAADGVDSPVRDSLSLLKWRRPANQFGYGAVIRRKPDELETEAGQTHCENWNGSRRLLYAPCTAELAYVQLISLAGDSSGNAVPIGRGFWRALFPHLHWIVDRIPDEGRGDWFEIIRLESWARGRVAIVGDAASAQPPFLGQGSGCSITSGFVLAHMIDREGDVLGGIAAWEMQERPFIEWVQRISYWYGQLAFLSASARTAVFKAVDASEWVKRQTLLAAACRDVTAPRRISCSSGSNAPIYPLIH
jgi:2-polyprenyl-6-methoxyphenol hydroxylase-like FAD-dependent oxidoreductase